MGYEYANHNGSVTSGEDDHDSRPLKRAQATTMERLQLGTSMYTLKAALAVPQYLRSWKEYFDRPTTWPNEIKTYDVRPHLPIRIFYPSSYDAKTSSKTLPTMFTIHGGGWSVGVNRDDDEWNREFADRQNVLVISLNFSKAPWSPYPAALYDLEALYHAVVVDESLPIARAAHSPGGRSRIGVLGFSTGGNLAMGLVQMPSVRGIPDAPSAVVSLYGVLDLSRNPHDKLRNRFYKPALPVPRGNRWDWLGHMMPLFHWSYVPYGHDLADPLLSPEFARREELPPHVFLVGCELDLVAHESWRLACRLANEGLEARGQEPIREVPDPESKADKVKCPGKRASSKRKGEIEVEDDERYAWSETWDDGSVNWLLVPDVLHAFDNKTIRESLGGDETIKDAIAKSNACQAKLGEWLHNVVWK